VDGFVLKKFHVKKKNYRVVLVYKFFVLPLSAVNIAANIIPTKNANTIVTPTTSAIPLGR